jgi:hypothetical protein
MKKVVVLISVDEVMRAGLEFDSQDEAVAFVHKFNEQNHLGEDGVLAHLDNEVSSIEEYLESVSD